MVISKESYYSRTISRINMPLEKINETQYFGYNVVIKKNILNCTCVSKKIQVQQRHPHHKIPRECVFFSYVFSVYFFIRINYQKISTNLYYSRRYSRLFDPKNSRRNVYTEFCKEFNKLSEYVIIFFKMFFMTTMHPKYCVSLIFSMGI